MLDIHSGNKEPVPKVSLGEIQAGRPTTKSVSVTDGVLVGTLAGYFDHTEMYEYARLKSGNALTKVCICIYFMTSTGTDRITKGKIC